jgi:citrate lyase subunit beta/citryl-CoA lyase
MLIPLVAADGSVRFLITANRHDRLSSSNVVWRICSMPLRDPDLRRTWLFGPGADKRAHESMLASGADALIVDLEDFTPPNRRDEARKALAAYVQGCRATGCVAAVRINALETEGTVDLAAAMATRPDVIIYPMSERAAQMHALDAAMTRWEASLGIGDGTTEIVPVCETALGVLDVRAIVGGSQRIRCALLGSEDLANSLCAERGPDAVELEHARRRFILECRAIGIEPIDAPYTFSDVDGAVREARFSRRLGYRSKSLVRPEHARPLNGSLTPDAAEIRLAQAIVDRFDAARARGEDRSLVNGLWVELPTYRNASRLIERARPLGVHM